MRHSCQFVARKIMAKRSQEGAAGVRYKGRMYSTLDSTAPSTTVVGTQSDAIKMPHGWELAKVDAEIISNVIAKYPWGAPVLIVAGGDGYYTGSEPCAGKLWSSGMNYELTAAGIRPTTSNLRILICKNYENLVSKRASLATAHMWTEKTFTDCEVICDGIATSCHRAVLAAVSPVFRQMLTVQMKEATSGRITIGEAKAPVVQSLLQFAYTGTIPEDPEHVLDLLALADQYQMAHLVAACAEEVLESGVLCAQSIVPLTRAVGHHKDHEDVQALWARLLELLAERQELLSVVALRA
eukprot:TRINITY_DN20084_c1_g3_i1.p1 TRINITY_DN20084_c1_g3~~TRINITY_DN20084_c1_g3_i1.p1  ORF type:complete len:297 (+),score=42.54 TRINITY_DN20084_c1_g3_i1:334-1224(+)